MLPRQPTCKELVQMDLKLKPECEGSVVRLRLYPAPQNQIDEIGRQMQECIVAALVEECKHRDCPRHCTPCFLVANHGSTALRLVVDCGDVNKKTQNHLGSIPNVENTPKTVARCPSKTMMEKRSGI